MFNSVEAKEGGVKTEEDVPACQLTIEDNRGPQRRIQTVGKEGAGAGAGGGGYIARMHALRCPAVQ